jgi:NTE family protein
LILGAGGARAFAHAGVLKALEMEHIPVHAVVGLEWGSLMAGIFAQEGRVHNLDWKLYKLRDEDLPGQSFLSKAFSKDGISIMSPYLKTVFEDSKIDKAKVDFACPTISTRNGSIGWMEKGSFRSAVEACLPYTPLFAAKDGRFAAPFDLAQAAQWLRRHGAEVVVFVDVLSEGNLWSNGQMPSDESARLLWWEVQHLYRIGAPGVDEVIKVPLASYNLGGFSKRKAISEVGLTAGKDLARRLMRKYNF